MPSVSVIIPAYNAERFIGETIRSVLGQSYTDFELIVVDDGSKDGTANLVQGFGGVRLVSKPNGGVSSARNLGVKHACGEWLAFVDADDLWHQHKLRDQVRLAQRYPEAVLGITAYSSVGQEILQRSVPEVNGLPPHRRDSDFGHVFTDPYLGMSGVFIRRQAFEKVGGFDQSLPYAEDVDFYLRLLYGTPGIVSLDYEAVYVRPVAGSLSSDSASGYTQLISVYEAFLKRHPEFHRARQDVVDKAMANLFCRHGRSLMWGGHRRGALAAAVHAWRLHPSQDAMVLGLRALVPSALTSALKKLKP